MPAITKQIILGDDELRKQAFMFLRMNSEFVMARRSGDHPHQLKASRLMLQARANIAVELSRLLGRDRSIAGQKLGIPMAIACWVSNLFASTNQLWGALVLMAMPVTTISLGVYLIFISTDSITKTQVFLAAKVTTAGGDVLEAISLVILDFIVRNRSIAAIVSLALATALRCCGKVFANSGEWSNGGVLLEILGEGGLCLLRWRLLLTEGRWKVSHDWGMVRRDQSVTVAEQAQLWTAMWEINYDPEFEDEEDQELAQVVVANH